MNIDKPTPFWDELLGFIKDNAVAGGLFLLLWRGIDKVANHYAEKRKAELKDMIKEEVGHLREEIEELRKLVYKK